MKTTAAIAKQLRDVHTGGNWTFVNFKDSLQDISWREAIHQSGTFNTIAVLIFHVTYYYGAIRKVLEGGPLDAKDKYSFELPPIQSGEDWERLKENLFAEAERLAGLIENFPDEKLHEPFSDGKYGSYYRNLAGVIEHSHYHLGQIVVFRKMMAGQ